MAVFHPDVCTNVIYDYHHHQWLESFRSEAHGYDSPIGYDGVDHLLYVWVCDSNQMAVWC